MIEIRQIEVSQVLTQVVPDRQAWGTVDDLIQEPEKILILELPSEQCLQNIVIDARIKFLYIEFQAVTCT